MDEINIVFNKLIDFICTKNGSYRKKKENEIQTILTTKEIDLLNKSYKNAKSLKEKIYLYRHGLTDVPICKECGKYLKFFGNYGIFCSVKCARNNTEVQEKYKKTCLRKYGTDNPSKNKTIKDKKINTHIKNYGTKNNFCDPKIKNKIKQTNQIKYGVDYPLESKKIHDKIKQTNQIKYGVDYLLESKEIHEKIKQTNLDKYGVDNLIKNKEFNKYLHEIIRKKYGGCGFGSEVLKSKIYETFYNKYGTYNIMDNKEILNKIFNSRKQNHTLNTSKFEELMYHLIKEKFPNVKRQYKDKKRYPWHCDFYIPELDYFIEIHGHWSHGKHPFDPNSNEDQILLEKWKKKYNNGEHPYYERAITGWTIGDVMKRNRAKKENLNFKEIWNLEDGENFIKSLKFN